MHIFDSLIKPIALYNSEIWAGYNTCYQNKSLDEMLTCLSNVIMNLIKKNYQILQMCFKSAF